MLFRSDDFSLQAVRSVLRQRGVDVSAVFADYAAANLHPAENYAEGADYPAARPTRTRRLTPREPVYRVKARTKHLTSRTYKIAPVRGLLARRWAVRFAISAPAPAFGGQVRLTYTRRDGSSTIQTIKLDRRGNAVVRRPFSPREVRFAEVSQIGRAHV